MGRDLVTEIWSGGQTGADRAAFDAALEASVRIGGWVPKDRGAEDGRIPDRYSGLRETETGEYAERTRRNVEDTDATLVLRFGAATGGTLETIRTAKRVGRPVCQIDMSVTDPVEAAGLIRNWLSGLGAVRRLNVAGPRASQAPALYALVRKTVSLVLGGEGGKEKGEG